MKEGEELVGGERGEDHEWKRMRMKLWIRSYELVKFHIVKSEEQARKNTLDVTRAAKSIGTWELGS